MKKSDQHVFQGMVRDVSISKLKQQFLWDANNIRLTAREGDTLMSMTNERGTKKIELKSDIIDPVIIGNYIGHCVIGNYLTVFTHVHKNSNAGTTTEDIEKQDRENDTEDYIFRIEKNIDGNYYITCLTGTYIDNKGKVRPKPLNLHFCEKHPLKTLGVYENKNIQKVYWTDGINQPRLINIVKDILDEKIPEYNEDSFDFIPRMQLKDSIDVRKVADSAGMFKAGAMQYVVTYYNKYAQETNVSCTSKLIPTSFLTRAGNAEERIGNTFIVTVNHVDMNYEFLRLYSIFRTSKNATPACKKVMDVDIRNLKSNIENALKNTKNLPCEIDPDFSVYEDYRTGVEKSFHDYKPVEVIYQGKAVQAYKFNKIDYPRLLISFQYPSPESNIHEGFYCVTYQEGSNDLYVLLVDRRNSEDESLAVITSDITKDEKDLQGCTYSQWLESLNEKIQVVDNGSIGDDVDPKEMLYLGGESITAETIEQKDGTLFMGNITVKRPNLSNINIQIGDTQESIRTALSKLGDKIVSSTRTAILPATITGDYYKWGNSLNAKQKDPAGYNYNENQPNIGTAGYKYGEHYRLGVQFQYKTGRWSEPVFLADMTETKRPNYVADTAGHILTIPTFTATIPKEYSKVLMDKGYVRARGTVVFPEASDRLVIAQGIVAPTVYSIGLRHNNTPYVQSSWFFRMWPNYTEADKIESGTYYDQYKQRHDVLDTLNDNSYALKGSIIQWKHNYTLLSDVNRGGEIQGVPLGMSNIGIDVDRDSIPQGENTKSIDLGYNAKSDDDKVEISIDQCNNIFAVDQQFVTMHSPEFEFDTAFSSLDTASLKMKRIGMAYFSSNCGDVDIQTLTPVIGSSSSGFFHKAINCNDQPLRKLCAGLFYKDYLVDDNGTTNIHFYDKQHYDFGYMVYPWQKSGSLNNDCNRVQGGGTRTAELNRKVISNLSFSDEVQYVNENTYKKDDKNFEALDYENIQFFNSEEATLTQVNNDNYFGNADMLLTPPVPYGTIFSNASATDLTNTVKTENGDKAKATNVSFTDTATWFWVTGKNGIWRLSNYPHGLNTGNYFGDKTDADIGRDLKGLLLTSEVIKLKYKSTPHTIVKLKQPLDKVYSIYWGSSYWKDSNNNILTPKDKSYLYLTELYRTANPSADFGGTTEEALQANLWFPAGEVTRLNDKEDIKIQYQNGDTFYQRYDCLKTYSFTQEDTNSVIDIGSFMVETRVNLDGRYDTHRGQSSNLYVHPKNFNLINDVYTQRDNFFNYRILDQDYYELNQFPSMITWSLAKNNASDVDAWTTITLASTLDVDGTNGEVTDIVTSKDTLYAFQERGISQLLFNSRVAVSTSDNVPIEISNNYKMSGNRYISTTVGCANRFAIAKAPSGVYFIDSIGSSLYLLAGDQMQDVSSKNGFSYWMSQLDTGQKWKPGYYYNVPIGMTEANNIQVENYYQEIAGLKKQQSSTEDDEEDIIGDLWEYNIKKDGNLPVVPVPNDSISVYKVNNVWLNSKGLALYYDENKKDLYISTPQKMLCYSEVLGQFVSFYDYQGGILFNIDSSFNALTNDANGVKTDFWEMFKGDYNMFFYDHHQTDFTFVSNPDYIYDKTFTNLEMRADFYHDDKDNEGNITKTLQHNAFFEKIQVWNEYQNTGEQALSYKLWPSLQRGNVQKKFRIWRCDIPRALKDGKASLDRIRNTWCKIKLSMNMDNASNKHFEMHDLQVIYYV